MLAESNPLAGSAILSIHIFEPSNHRQTGSASQPSQILSITVSFALTAGLVEGPGLLLFQRLNWRSWGSMTHVAKPILWVSPLVDLVLFGFVAVLISLAARVARFDLARVLAVALSFLAIYDWLAVTSWLAPWSSFFLALGSTAVLSRKFGQRETTIPGCCRRAMPWLLAGWALAFITVEGGAWISERNAVAGLPHAAEKAPNVIVIVVDTLRADHVSSHGYARRTSPEIDRIAQQGVLFENAIAATSWSLPSHASLLTGRYPFEHGMQNVEPMPWRGWGRSSLRGYPTLGEVLEQHGYRTGAFSANRVYFTRNVGLGRGFIRFEDYFHSPADAFVRTLFGREFARIYLSRSDKSLVRRLLRRAGFSSLLDRDTEGWQNNGGARGVRKRASVVNDELLRWIDSGPGRDRPFLAFLNYMDAHDPYGIPADYPKPSWDHRSDTDNYDAGISYADHYIGLLMESLRQRGLSGNTLVVITSDHGESLGEHGLHYHASALYWELIHVPLVIWFPGHVPAGMRIATPVTNAAIPSTITDLLAMERFFPGPTLTGLWKQPESASRCPHPLAELVENNINPQKATVPVAADGPMQSLVTADWQLIVQQRFGEQLYDWKTDPGETNNLVATPEGRAEADKLRLELKARTRGSMP